jgi:hypothetical protein
MKTPRLTRAEIERRLNQAYDEVIEACGLSDVSKEARRAFAGTKPTKMSSEKLLVGGGDHDYSNVDGKSRASPYEDSADPYRRGLTANDSGDQATRRNFADGYTAVSIGVQANPSPAGRTWGSPEAHAKASLAGVRSHRRVHTPKILCERGAGEGR